LVAYRFSIEKREYRLLGLCDMLANVPAAKQVEDYGKLVVVASSRGMINSKRSYSTLVTSVNSIRVRVRVGCVSNFTTAGCGPVLMVALAFAAT
jgi:hypothetical protein